MLDRTQGRPSLRVAGTAFDIKINPEYGRGELQVGPPASSESTDGLMQVSNLVVQFRESGSE